MSSTDCSSLCDKFASKSSTSGQSSDSNPIIVPSPIHLDPTDLTSNTPADLKSATADDLQIMFNLQNDWEKTPVDVNSIINPNDPNNTSPTPTNSQDFVNDL